ncbi:vitamin k-dependent gamma-carboxylase-like isoform x1 [Dermatophagoides farinae]|uniref:Vitamin k-dependent gamma-carboxylase-like isoform x1 n=1 Tax=Dermatophagoides farinae TaxID=6954 RepID=A0A9D4NV38_DERFA|nr:vitamin k-dependent gamma-carboxylase-like isoform x1 [Dermatophagoides farinae]
MKQQQQRNITTTKSDTAMDSHHHHHHHHNRPVNRFIRFLFQPSHASSLAFNRIIIGILLFIDTFHERGLSRADIIWSETMIKQRCRFPLFESLSFDSNVQPSFIYAIYTIMIIGLIGIILGYHYRLSTFLYTITYWILLMQDRSRWNNHSYLFGLLAIQLLMNDSNHKWSLDSFWNNRKNDDDDDYIEHWQYFLLRFQIFIVYFYAGLKKFNPDWLSGYSMINISQNWIFRSAMLLSIPDYWIDYYLIHLIGFIFDLFVGFLLIYQPTRWLAFILCSIFNLINSQLFQIGMFPWIMLAIMPIFCRPDWPMIIIWKLGMGNKFCNKNPITDNSHCNTNVQNKQQQQQPQHFHWNIRRIFVAIFVILYIIIQLTLPFAFLIFRGYNTWTTGIYGYNWDMMVHNWNHLHTQIKIRAHDRRNNETIIRYLDSESWTHNNRWTHHADMAKQFARCVEQKLRMNNDYYEHIELYLDVWTSLNGRFAQRIFDPNVDLIRAQWSPFEMADWIIPIYPQSNYWRQRLLNHFESFDSIIRQNEQNGSLTLFLADRPYESFRSYIDDNFIEPIRLIIFDRTLMIRMSNQMTNNEFHEYILIANDQLQIPPGTMIELTTIGSSESYFALLYPHQLSINNKNQLSALDEQQQQQQQSSSTSSSYSELIRKRNAYIASIKHIAIGIHYLIWDCIIITITRLLFETIDLLRCLC